MFEKRTIDTTGTLPSLNSLRAFEAMARTGSATRAAEELGVTHSAVSRQVKALEAQLGVRLFEGPKHRLALTKAGRELAPPLSGAFDQIAAAVAQSRGRGQDLHLAVNASLAVKWLIPRLPLLELAHPELRIHLAELAPQATQHRGADLLLRLVSAEQCQDADVHPLIPNMIGPVLSPRLAGNDPLAALDSANHLVAKTHLGAWQNWYDLSSDSLAYDAPTVRPLAHIHFVLDAAIAGLGAAVLPWAIVADAVRDGQLVAPLGFVSDGGAIAVLAGAGEDTRPRRALIRWLESQAASMLPAPMHIPDGGRHHQSFPR